MWKFIVNIVHDFVSSLQPDVGRGFLHVSNVFLLKYRYKDKYPGTQQLLDNGVLSEKLGYIMQIFALIQTLTG